jgi:hypothetical protein
VLQLILVVGRCFQIHTAFPSSVFSCWSISIPSKVDLLVCKGFIAKRSGGNTPSNKKGKKERKERKEKRERETETTGRRGEEDRRGEERREKKTGRKPGNKMETIRLRHILAHRPLALPPLLWEAHFPSPGFFKQSMCYGKSITRGK